MARKRSPLFVPRRRRSTVAVSTVARRSARSASIDATRDQRLGEHAHPSPWSRLSANAAAISTVLMLVVAVATAMIAWRTDQTANRQTQLTNAQKAIMSAEVQPEFRLVVWTEPGHDTHPSWMKPTPRDVVARVDNVGARILDFHIQPYVFIDVTMYDKVGNEDVYGVHDILIPMPDAGAAYPDFRTSKGSLAGVDVVMLRGDTKLFRTAFPAAYAKRHTHEGDAAWHQRGVFHVYQIILVGLRYTDMLGESHSTLLVAGPTLSQPLPSRLSAQLVADYNAKASREDTSWSFFTNAHNPKAAANFYRMCFTVHTRFPQNEVLWGQAEVALGHSGETGVYVNHYEWPID